MEKAKLKTLATLLIVALALSIAPTRTPTVLADTITGRPTIYVDNITGDPLSVPAGSSVNIHLGGMTISGAQVWLWISKTGGAVIEPGDKFIVGPFYVGDVFDTTTTHSYKFVPGVNLTSPWSLEGRTYTYTVGYGWINGTMPLMVEGGVYYWVKITDVDPRLGTSIPSSDVSVSTNRIVFTPAFVAKPSDGSNLAPGTPITIKGYALPLTEKYNITQDNVAVHTLLSPQTYTVDDWVYVGLEVPPFQLMDLKLKSPATTGTVTVKVIANSTNTVEATFTYYEPARVVYLPPDQLRNDGEDYTSLVLKTGGYYNITLNWFPYNGSVDMYLNTTLVASSVALNDTGGVYYTIRIPNLRSGKYYFRVVDNYGVEYNFTVSVVMVPYIEVEPTSGCVGDSFNVKGYNFLEYVGQYVTIYFERKSGEYALLANFTVPDASWSKPLTVPLAVGGDRSVEVRDIKGTTPIASTTFTVLPKVVVVPSTIKNDGSPFFVNGTGFGDGDYLTVNVDNQALLPGNIYICCNEYGSFNITLVAAGFRPGLHAVTVYKYEEEGSWKPPAYYATFTVTVEGDPIVEFLKSINATIVGIRDGMAVIRAGQEELKVSLSAISARIESISGDVATIKTDVGTIKTDVSALKPVVTEIKDGVATVSTAVGAIKGKVETIDGNVATIRTDVGTIKATVTDVKAVAEAALSTAKSAESVASSLMIPVWIAAAFAIIATIIAIASVVLIQRKIAK